VKNEINWFFH